MAGIEVRTMIDATADEVWAAIEDVGGHTDWMADAVEIRFTSERTRGVGTTFECDTKVGPLRLTDRMEVTEWEPGRTMGVRHVGVVVGEGRFVLRPTPDGRTEFAWTEVLFFPWWLGGRVGALLATPALRRIWRANLRRLKQAVESA